ncbi:hypothetical protein ACFLU6_05030, partial [Acidobacteriota bacterium]
FYTLRFWTDGRECFLVFSGLYRDLDSMKKDLDILASKLPKRYLPRGITIESALKFLPAEGE